MKKRIILGTALIVVLGVMVIGKKTRSDVGMEYIQEAVVEAEHPKIGNITLKTELIGKIEPEDVVYVYPKISGTVIQMDVKAGDSVKAGKQLCIIESTQVDTAKNRMAAAELALRQAKEKLGRQTILYQGGGVSEEQYRQCQDEVTSADLNYKDAKTQYEDTLSQSRLTAPIDGIVETAEAKVHNFASPQNPVCVISGQGDKIVSFSVTDRIRKNLQENDEISIRKDGETYTGRIREISSLADSSTGLFLVKARLESGMAVKDLTTGSMVEVTVVSARAEQVMIVPADAVYQDVDQMFVYTYQDGVVHKTQVETGISDEIVTEIKSGLADTDQVLKTWSSDLYDGATVRLLEQESEENMETEEKQEGA